MCGRFIQDISYKDLKNRFAVGNQSFNLSTNYNITPGMMVPVIINNAEKEAVLMRWGLIPFWAKDPKIGYKMINARMETLLSKPSFKRPLYNKRCLVPTSGFYEWKKLPQAKIPYVVKMKSGQPFALAGLYDSWRDAEGKTLNTFTIITTGPNELVAQIHNRMPAILTRTDEQTWLNKEITNPQQLLDLLKPYSTLDLEAYPISRDVNNPDNNSRNLIEHV